MAASSTLIGLACAAGAACCFDGAVIVQATEARSVSSEHSLRLSLIRQLAKRKRWLIGTALAILGWPLQLVALSLAPITLVQPALALGSILLLTIGARVLNEPVGSREWVCIGILITGVALLTSVAPPHTDYEPSLQDMLIVTIPLILLALLPLFIGREKSGLWVIVISAGAAISLGAFMSKLVTIQLAHDNPGLALLFASGTVLAAAFAFVVDMSALQRFEATRITPPIFVFETAVPVIAAPFILGEKWSATAGGGSLVVAGLFLVLLGGAVLASGAKEIEEELLGGSEHTADGLTIADD